MADPLILRVTLAGVGLAVAAGPLGALVLWRRMAYFGETLSHAALLGVALALAVDLPVLSGVLLVGLAVAGLVALPRLDGLLHHDARLGVAAHAALALGLVAVAVLPGMPPDPMRYLAGDVLSVSTADLVAIWAGALVALGLVLWQWEGLVLATIDADLARARGHAPDRQGVLFSLAVAVLVAVAIKVVGALLIVALLIIPAAAARPLSATPERMALLAALAAVLATVSGLGVSVLRGTPAGPSVVVAALVVLVLSALAARFGARLKRRGSGHAAGG